MRVKFARARHRIQRGMTLVELMVAMAIGLGVTLAITTLLIAGENHKRTTTSTNDVEQTGAYAAYTIDRIVRGAGSGFVQSAHSPDRGVFDCRLAVSGFLPRGSAFPPPFSTAFLAGTTANLRVAPLLIAKAQSDVNANGSRSDVLVVMGGSGAAGGVSRQVTSAGSSTTLVLDNTVGFFPSDVMLVSQSGVTDCLLEEVLGTPTTTTLTVSGTPYYTASGGGTSLGTLATSSATYVTPLGNAASNNLQFMLLGVNGNRTLYSYDLLQNLNKIQGSGGDVAQAIADGVDQLHAIYGIDGTGTGSGKQTTWADPSGTYDISAIMNSASATTTLLNIVSVRIALLVRGEYYDKNQVSPATITLFGGLTNSSGATVAVSRTISLSATDQHYRYRVFEFTVPLRNVILVAGGP